MDMYMYNDDIAWKFPNIIFSRPAELRVSGEEITVSLRFDKPNPLGYGGSESVGKPRINELYAPPAARIGAY